MTQKRKNRAYECIKPVPKLCAQTVVLCGDQSDELAMLYGQIEVIMRRSDITVNDKAVIELSFMGGFRISSILRLSGKNVKSDGSLYIEQDKGSMSLTYTSFYCREFWFDVKKYNYRPFEGLSRYYYHRLFVKLGINKRFEGNSKQSVTHVGRHLKGLSYKNDNLTDRDKAKILGHKNIENLKYYEKEISANQER